MLILFQSQAVQEPDDAVFTYEPGTRLSCVKSYFFVVLSLLSFQTFKREISLKKELVYRQAIRFL